jgi:S1-C subfamily serine protease
VIKTLFLALTLSLLTACSYAPTHPDFETIIQTVSVGIDSQPGICSGVVISENKILTAGHCVGRKLKAEWKKDYPTRGDLGGCLSCDDDVTVEVTINNQTLLARVFKYDESQDMAILIVPGVKFKSWMVIAEEGLKIGDELYTVGNPRGLLPHTVTKGIVSANNRLIKELKLKLLQMDLTAAPGNSGGMVLNSKGELVGILIAGLFNAQSEFAGQYAFAITIENMKKFLEGNL